jgi:hypothetical protein
MALHDINSDVRRRDSCHELAWTLDACINRGMLAAEHLARLQVRRLQPLAAAAPPSARAGPPSVVLVAQPDPQQAAGSKPLHEACCL